MKKSRIIFKNTLEKNPEYLSEENDNIDQYEQIEQIENEESNEKNYEEIEVKFQPKVNNTEAIVTTKIIQDIKEIIPDVTIHEELKNEDSVNPQQPQIEIIAKRIKPHEVSQEEHKRIVEMIFPSFKGHHN